MVTISHVFHVGTYSIFQQNDTSQVERKKKEAKMNRTDKTHELNNPNNDESTVGLYPIPDGKIYLAIWANKHGGELGFYAVDDKSAIEYVKEGHPNDTPTSLSEVVITYREIPFFEVGMRVKVPIGQYEIVTKSDDEYWSEIGKLLHTIAIHDGILLKYADHPDYGWNIYIPDHDLMVFITEKALKESK